VTKNSKDFIKQLDKYVRVSGGGTLCVQIDLSLSQFS
jgi:hypothetical protein